MSPRERLLPDATDRLRGETTPGVLYSIPYTAWKAIVFATSELRSHWTSVLPALVVLLLTVGLAIGLLGTGMMLRDDVDALLRRETPAPSAPAGAPTAISAGGPAAEPPPPPPGDPRPE